MLIRPKRIYNFDAPCLFYTNSTIVLYMFWCVFISFLELTYLTRCRSDSSCFLLFFVSEILHRKYSQNWTGQKPEIMYLPCQHRRTRGSRRSAPGRPHPPQARPRAGPRRGMVRPTWAATDLASPLFIPRQGENSKYPSTIP